MQALSCILILTDGGARFFRKMFIFLEKTGLGDNEGDFMEIFPEIIPKWQQAGNKSCKRLFPVNTLVRWHNQRSTSVQ